MTGDSLRVVQWQRDRRNSRVGYATVRCDPPGLLVQRVVVQESHGMRWVTLPAAPVLDSNGQPLRDERGKIAHVAVVTFPDKADRDAFADAVIAVVRRHSPEAFDDADAALPLEGL
ncbi:hypothetical protein BB934_22375 [Microvirga ossetica]|uniref:Uncharacterized protein n=1 Tax=Microvirga ossetica TaxID=1882682 RepID=A0A1B2EKY1_9HYPH|nr:hypothetical protein [Microvirga ossetica]ANY80636.1 hypothetical protein BB934_22375 [Microvirga ossetica]